MNNTNIIKGTNSQILLVGKIKGLAEEAKHTRQLLLKNKRKMRNGVPLVDIYAITKNIIGADIRHHLLAYAWMRGESYHNLERKVRPGGEARPDVILQIVHAHLPFSYPKSRWTLEAANAWIKGEV